MLKRFIFMLTGIYIFMLYDMIDLSNERGESCMKLTNNLAIDNQLEIYRQTGFSYVQTREIKRGLTLGFDPSLYANVDFATHQIEMIIECLVKNLNVIHLSKDCYNWMQVDEIYKGLLSGIDVSCYADKDIHWVQMSKIRKQLELERKQLEREMHNL